VVEFEALAKPGFLGLIISNTRGDLAGNWNDLESKNSYLSPDEYSLILEMKG
jgi:hypothetical protein